MEGNKIEITKKVIKEKDLDMEQLQQEIPDNVCLCGLQSKLVKALKVTSKCQRVMKGQILWCLRNDLKVKIVQSKKRNIKLDYLTIDKLFYVVTIELHHSSSVIMYLFVC